MKRILKSRIFYFILGAIIFGGIGVSATILYQARDIGFTPESSSWNVNNLEDALNDLYENSGEKPTLLWINPNPDSNFGAQTINLDLSEYKYVIIITKAWVPSHDTKPRTAVVVRIGGGRSWLFGNGQNRNRGVTVNDSGIIFENESAGSNGCIVPYKAYGVKQDLGLDLGIDE